jgi:hypothetical protein
MAFEHGSKNLSTTELAYKLIADLKPLMELLSLSDRRILQEFCDYILQQRVPIANATDLLPLEVAFVIIQLEEHKKNNHEFVDLSSQLQELRAEIEKLKSANEDI